MLDMGKPPSCWTSHPDPEPSGPRRWLADQAAASDLRGVRDVGNTAWGRLLMESPATGVLLAAAV